MGPLPRRALAAAAAVAVLAAGGGWLFLASRDAPPSARLRPGAGAGSDGRPDGRWVVAQDADGFVGYRVRERLGSISAPNDVVGRSPAVSGTVTIAGGAVTGAEVTVDMTRLRTDVEPRDGRMRDEGLETARFPTASFRLRQPVPLGDVAGARVVELRLPGELTLHGVTRAVEFPVQARWDGTAIQVAGGMRVRRADFDLEVPSLAGYRIEDTAVVELELTLVRAGASLAGPVSTLRRATAVPQAAGEEPGRPRGEPCRGGGRPPGGGGRLLFTAITSDDAEHLFTIGADGRGLRRVGGDDASELDPTWSPDGRRIAYAGPSPTSSARRRRSTSSGPTARPAGTSRPASTRSSPTGPPTADGSPSPSPARWRRPRSRSSTPPARRSSCWATPRPPTANPAGRPTAAAWPSPPTAAPATTTSP